MERRSLGTPLGILVIAGLTLGSVGGAVLHPPGLRSDPWKAGAPGGATGARRIVSTNVGVDEILLSLVDPSRLAALSPLADDPEICSATDLARAVKGRLKQMDVERVLALEPDLVVVPPYTRREVVLQLEEAGVDILRMPDFRGLEDIRVHIRLLGSALGEPGRAEGLVREMDGRLEAVRARSAGKPKVRALYLGANGDTMGMGTDFDLFLEAAGGLNLAAEAGIRGRAHLPLERALALDPELILVSSYRGGGRARGLEGDPAWSRLKAVKAGRVQVLNGAHLLSTSHHATKLAEDLERILHP